jgi:hypothetical protein
MCFVISRSEVRFLSPAVLDKETGSCVGAITEYKHANLGGCSSVLRRQGCGWSERMGAPHDSVVDPAQNNPALPAGHPFSNVQPDDYWSATTSASDASAVVLYLPNGGVASAVKEASTNFVWCVRGGQGGPDAR